MAQHCSGAHGAYAAMLMWAARGTTPEAIGGSVAGPSSDVVSTPGSKWCYALLLGAVVVSICILGARTIAGPARTPSLCIASVVWLGGPKWPCGSAPPREPVRHMYQMIAVGNLGP